MNKLSTSQLSQYLAVTKRTIQRRANREQWLYVEHVGLGGVRKLYYFSSLPRAVKQKVISGIIAAHEAQGQSYALNQADSLPKDLKFDPCNSAFIVLDKSKNQGQDDWLSQHCFAHDLDTTALDSEFVKTGLLVLAHLYVLNIPAGKIKGFDRFCQLYNQRQLALNPVIYSIINNLSRISLLRWEKQQQQCAQQWLKNDENNTPMDRDLRQMGEEMLMVSPDISAKRLRQYLLTIFTDRKIPSERYLSQWLKLQRMQQWQPNNHGAAGCLAYHKINNGNVYNLFYLSQSTLE